MRRLAATLLRIAYAAMLVVALYTGLLWLRRYSAPVSLTVLRGHSEAIAGAYHVHSSRSHDSRITPEQWALAARAQGLDFVVLTDHNADPMPPAVMHGVLMLFELEASTSSGHEVRWPGFRVAAHPFDRKRPWDVGQAQLKGLSGLEIASASAAARRLMGPLFLGIVPAVFWAGAWPEAGLAQLYARDDQALSLWDGPLGAGMGGLCALDAHGWLPQALELAVWRMVLPELPRTRPLRIEQAQDVLRELALGRGQCVSGMLPGAAAVQIWGQQREGPMIAAGGEAMAHDTLQTLVAQAPELARWAGPGHMRLRLLRDGEVVCEGQAEPCTLHAPGPGVYRAEVDIAVPQGLWGQGLVPMAYSPRLTLTP